MAKKYQNLFAKGSLIKDKGLLQHQQVKTKITVLPELEALIPPLREDEFAQLEANIQKEGCREALLIWDHQGGYILVDGHNRYRICQKHQLDFKINLMKFTDLDAVKDWMIDNQLGRRNLTSEQTSYLRGMRYNLEKQEKGGYDKVKSKGQNDLLTAERLAEEYQVSGKTIKRDAQFARGLEKLGEQNPRLKQDILSGSIKVNKADVQKLAKLKQVKKLSSVDQISELIKSKSRGGATVLKTKEERVKVLEHRKQRVQTLVAKLALGKADNKAIYQELVQEVNEVGQLIEKQK